jgi:hypothetical protein
MTPVLRQFILAVLTSSLPEARLEFGDTAEGLEDGSISAVSLGPFLETDVASVFHIVAEDPGLPFDCCEVRDDMSVYFVHSHVEREREEEMDDSREFSAFSR